MSQALKLKLKIEQIDEQLRQISLRHQKAGTGFDPDATTFDEAFLGLEFTAKGRADFEAIKHGLLLERGALSREYDRLPSKLKEGLEDV